MSGDDEVSRQRTSGASVGDSILPAGQRESGRFAYTDVRHQERQLPPLRTGADLDSKSRVIWNRRIPRAPFELGRALLRLAALA